MYIKFKEIQNLNNLNVALIQNDFNPSEPDQINVCASKPFQFHLDFENLNCEVYGYALTENETTIGIEKFEQHRYLMRGDILRLSLEHLG